MQVSRDLFPDGLAHEQTKRALDNRLHLALFALHLASVGALLQFGALSARCSHDKRLRGSLSKRWIWSLLLCVRQFDFALPAAGHTNHTVLLGHLVQDRTAQYSRRQTKRTKNRAHLAKVQAQSGQDDDGCGDHLFAQLASTLSNFLSAKVCRRAQSVGRMAHQHNYAARSMVSSTKLSAFCSLTQRSHYTRRFIYFSFSRYLLLYVLETEKKRAQEKRGRKMRAPQTHRLLNLAVRKQQDLCVCVTQMARIDSLWISSSCKFGRNWFHFKLLERVVRFSLALYVYVHLLLAHPQDSTWLHFEHFWSICRLDSFVRPWSRERSREGIRSSVCTPLKAHTKLADK